MADKIETFLAGLSHQEPPQVCLVQGDLVLAEPAALRVAEALAKGAGIAVETYRHPPSLSPLLQDLRTFSLFASAKVVLAVDTAAFADREAASELIDDAAGVLPLSSGGAARSEDRALSAREREAASRLLQVLRLFDLDPYAGAADRTIGELPAWVLEGRKSRGGRARGKKQLEELRTGLVGLLEAARAEGIQGVGEGEVVALGEVIRTGLPPGHALVLAERAVAKDHPLVALLEERGALLRVGEIEAERGSWQGIELLVEELERQTGVGIAPDAVAELARRTLRQEEGRGQAWGGPRAVEADSTARFAGEYRKLAHLAAGQGGAEPGGRIDRRLVEQAVEDRGEEDVWQLLDAIAAGRGGEALDRLRRHIGSAEDPLNARLAFFGLLVAFCRQLIAVRGMMRIARIPAGEASYPRFRDRHALALQSEVPGGGKNPLSGLHPFRLHRAYLAAGRFPELYLAKLPADLLDAEMQLKGESADADTALSQLVARLSAAAAPAPRSGR